MKKLLLILFLTCITGTFSLFGQIYMFPVIHYETSPGACDGSVDLITYGTVPPYSITWFTKPQFYEWDPDRFSLSDGLHLENACEQFFIEAKIIDGNCHELEVMFPFKQQGSLPPPILDTIIITYPTIANNDGGIELHFFHVNNSMSTYLYNNYTFDTYEDDSVFTGLPAGKYTYYIIYGGEFYYSISIPLYIGDNAPCDPFRMELDPGGLTWEETGSACDGNYAVPQGYDCENYNLCDGYFNVTSTGNTSNDYTYWGHSALKNGLFSWGDPYTYYTCLCRSAYYTYGYADESTTPNKYVTERSFFLWDTGDMYYTWNEPGSVPMNTDTLVLDALHVPAIGFYLEPDTAYVDEVKYLDSAQYEIKLGIIQQTTDTFFVHHVAYLDSTYNYMLDFTTYEGDSLTCGVADYMRNIVYMPALDENFRSAWINKPLSTNHPPPGVEVFPNPFTNELQVRSAVKIERIEVYSIDGKLKKRIALNSLTAVLNTNELPPAAYLVKTIDVNGQAAFVRIVKIE